MVCCILCGCRKESKRVGRPSRFPEAPSKVLCPNCGCQAEGEYRIDHDRFCICIIPCCCKCKASDPYVACSKCRQPLGITTGSKCDNCDLVTSFRSQNCPGCGARK